MAEWTAAEVDAFPDGHFLYVEPGDKDSEGKTTPRSKRHFPFKNASGSVDLAHLRNALARIPQSNLPPDKKEAIEAHARKLLSEEKGDSSERVFRFDLSSGTVGARRATPQGGLIADANLTRTGVFTYRMPDGSSRRELRHPDEVFHPDSLATYRNAPVTVDHPGRVGPDNWKTHAVGTIGSDVRRHGDFVAGEIHIQHGSAIQRADSGDLREVSCGYACDIDHVPGTYMGQPYDAAQRNIRINHVAIGPKGWARMGPETKMHLDSASAISGEDARSPEEMSAAAREASLAASRARDTAMGTGATTGLSLREHHKPLEKAAGEAHIAAAEAHKRAAKRLERDDVHGSETHLRHAAAHMNQASDHARAAGDEWNSGTHPIGDDGKLDGADLYLREREDTRTMPDTADNKAALDKATADLDKANTDLAKARQDAKDAKSEGERLVAQTRADAAEIAQLKAQRQLDQARIAQLEAEKSDPAARQRADAAQQAAVEELIAVRADAKSVFATVADPEAKNWKSDGKTADAIRREILATIAPDLKLDGIDAATSGAARIAAVKGIYDTAMKHKRAVDQARNDAMAAVTGPKREDGSRGGDDDGDEDDMPADAAKARKDMIARKKNDWKTPRKDRGKPRAA